MTSPRQHFLEQEDRAIAWRQVVTTKTFDAAMSAALAEFATYAPSAEQLVGANRFRTILSNIAEKELPVSEFQMPRLTPPESLVPYNDKKKA